ncbi:MAG: glycosyltransferase [Patescibacteria group bacterium]
MGKVLSICIPTYNRAEFLQYNLLSITDQFDVDPSLKDLVEIVISDNASADGTKEMMAGFVEKYANIIYTRNDTNIGFDRNLNNAIKLASGKYCLTLGDDDALFPEALSVLVKKVLATNVPYYLVGHVGYSRDMRRAYKNEHDAGAPEDRLYGSLQDYVRSLGGYVKVIGIFGGMSTHVFLRETWLSYADLEKYFGSLHIHTNVFLRAFKNLKFMVLPDLIVKTRGDNMRWEDIVGLETTRRRNLAAFKGFLWIKRLYDLPQSTAGAFVYFVGRGYWIAVKELIKKFLVLIGCDKYFKKRI